MKHDEAVTGLKRVRSKTGFMKACREIVNNADHVKIDNSALKTYAESMRKPAFIPNWHDYLSDSVTTPDAAGYITDTDKRMERAFFELALSCSVNAGYTYKGADGQTQKWEVGGSGAAALMDRFAMIWEGQSVPGIHVTREDAAKSSLTGIFASAPAFAQERVNILSGFAAPAARETLNEKIGSARGQDGAYHIDFKHLKQIAKVSADGFAEDPFLKKAALLPIMFAGYAGGEGVDVELDTIIPADYRVPQTWHNLGILRLSDEFVKQVEAGRLFDENDPMVTELRAATVLAGDDIVSQVRPRLLAEEGFSYQIHHLDGEAWFAGRLFDKAPEQLDDKKRAIRASFEKVGQESRFNESGFMKRAQKAVNVSTMRF